MTFNEDRRSETLAAPAEFPQAWWNVLHAMHGAPNGFQPSRPALSRNRQAPEVERVKDTTGLDSPNPLSPSDPR